MATLRELLEKDGFGSGSDSAITVYDGPGTMHVSHRYLCGGWQDKLNSEAERISKGVYEIKK